MTPDVPDEVWRLALGAVSFCLVGLVGAVAWFVRSGFARNDESNARVEGKVDALAKSALDVALTQGQQITELRLRVGALETDASALREWRREIGGFLQSKGFRKADGP